MAGKVGNVVPYEAFSLLTHMVAYAVGHGGNSPTIDEMAAELDLYRNAIASRLETLYRHGLAERVDGKLVIAELQVIPPRWYIDQLLPEVSHENKLATARRNTVLARSVR